MLVERFGCRVTVMVGGFLSGLGMALSALARTITDIYVTSGITGQTLHTPANPHFHSYGNLQCHQTLCPLCPLFLRTGILPFFPAISDYHGSLLCTPPCLR